MNGEATTSPVPAIAPWNPTQPGRPWLRFGIDTPETGHRQGLQWPGVLALCHLEKLRGRGLRAVRVERLSQEEESGAVAVLEMISREPVGARYRESRSPAISGR